VWIALAIVFFATAVYLPSLDNAFVYDDAHLLQRDQRVTEAGHIGEIWGGDYWPGDRPSYNYRPLTTTSFALIERLNLSQRGFNLLLHAACSVVAFMLSRRLGLSLGAAAFSGLLFALHPLHSEAIYLVVGRGELLAALMGLLFLMGVLKERSPSLLSLLYGAALFSKEGVVLLPVIALLFWWLAHRGESLRDLVRAAVRIGLLSTPPVALLFAVRFAVFGIFLSPSGYVSPLYNPLVSLATPLRLLNALWVQWRYLGSMLFPLPLRADYSWQQMELVSSIGEPRAVLALVLLCSIIIVCAANRRKWTLEITGVLFIVLALLPASNLFFPIGVAFGERLAYLPLFGFCLVCAGLLDRLLGVYGENLQMKRVLLLLSIVLFTLCAVSIVRRDRAWQDDEHFTAALVVDSPRSALAHGLRFLTLRKRNDMAGARTHVLRAIELYPAYFDAWDSYGDLLARQGDMPGAAEAFVRAAEEVSRFPYDKQEASVFYSRAAKIEAALGQCEAAWHHLEEAAHAASPADLPHLRQIEGYVDRGSCRRP
jgi:tetratricopeptide (TPR) repeat protein